jgi:hypothetical protein
MTAWKAWSLGLTVALVAVGCGNSSNDPDEQPVAGSAGKPAAGSSSGGSAAGGSTTTGGSASRGGSTSQGGSGGSTSLGGSGGSTSLGGSAAGGSVNQAGTGGGSSVCLDPVPFGGGWEQCGDGKLRRPTVASCEYAARPRKLEATGQADECHEDADCKEKPNGMCELRFSGFSPAVNACSYGCVQDSDCGASEVCVCGSATPFEFGQWHPRPAGTCYRTEGCSSDADCAGKSCSAYDERPGCYSPVFACESADDECSVPEDCQGFPAESCSFDETHRICQPASCAI